MDVRILPFEICGSISAPPSKSAAHRLLICAGLADGTSRISGISLSQDILATCDCLRSLGATVLEEDDTLVITGTDVTRAKPAELGCRESGSTLRFFIPMCALSGSEMILQGSSILLSRPLSVYEKLFSENRLVFDAGSESVTVKGPLGAGEYTIDASISSQFISGLLFALPLAEGDSVLRLIPPVESRGYIDMTLDAMNKFGVEAKWTDAQMLYIPGGQRYKADDLEVEGDWSNAAFFLAMGAGVSGLDSGSIQGDKVCVEYFRALDEGPAELNIADCPDLGPVLMAYAALRHGCRLNGTRRLRYKESDRIEAMKEELSKFGISVTAGDDTLTVSGDLHAPSLVLAGHNDHRVVMALAVMCAVTGGVIEGAEAVWKSFPDFFDRLRETGASIELLQN